LKFCAKPDRWRRRRWAQRLKPAAPVVPTNATAAAELSATGFSPWQLDEHGKRSLLDDWNSLQKLQAEGAGEPVPRTTGKTFVAEMLSDRQLGTLPALFSTAVDEGVLTAVMQTMGLLPHLESIDIIASRHTGPKLTASQLWHYDVNDVRIVKLFVYLNDCGPQNGPFTFIPAASSRRIAGAVGHYVGDEHIETFVPRSQWRVVEGAAGTAFLIDTGRCYHFGSRSIETRYAYVATYSSGIGYMRRSSMWGAIVGQRSAELSPLQRAVCAIG
jgi:hypothetical protein